MSHRRAWNLDISEGKRAAHAAQGRLSASIFGYSPKLEHCEKNLIQTVVK